MNRLVSFLASVTVRESSVSLYPSFTDHKKEDSRARSGSAVLATVNEEKSRRDPHGSLDPASRHTNPVLTVFGMKGNRKLSCV